jgi:hypothetical protein
VRTGAAPSRAVATRRPCWGHWREDDASQAPCPSLFILISIWRIQGGAVTPTGTIVEGDLAADADFDVPTTLAFAGGSLWAVNARFTTSPTPATPYWITRVPIN